MSSDNNINNEERYNSFFIYRVFGNLVKVCFYIDENSTIEEVLRKVTLTLNFELYDTIDTTKVSLNGQDVQLSDLVQKGIYLISGCQHEKYEIKSIKPFANNLD